MTRIEYLFRQLEMIYEWYKRAEDKAGLLIGLNTLALGVVNGLVFVGADEIRAVRGLYTPLIAGLLALAGLALIASYLQLLRVVRSRHDVGDDVGDMATEPTDRLWFFGDIAGMSREQHREAMAAWDERTLERSLLSQVHILSRNVVAKHTALNRAVTCTVIALLLVLALGIAYGVAVGSAS
jgi:Family of unknown function (DUF5706)